MTLRIVAGKKKGLVLKAPIPEGVRPTSDKAREALFMLLTQGAWRGNFGNGTRFADLCAGVGAVGIEAWSRGFEVVFVENNADALRSLKQNVAKIRDFEQLTVLQANAFALAYAPRGFEIIFVDPPYSDMPNYPQAVRHWLERGWLRKDSRLVIQLDKGKSQELLESLTQTGQFSLVEQRTYGRNVLVSGVLL